MLHNRNKSGYENLTTDELHKKLAETQKDLDEYKQSFEARDPMGYSQPPYLMTAI